MENLVERLREEAGRDDIAYRTVTVLMDAALKIEQLEAALKTAHDVFAGEIEGLHKIILMNQPDYKRTIVASVDGL